MPLPRPQRPRPIVALGFEVLKARCSCSGSDSIFDVMMKVEGCDFEDAKLRIAQILNRDDLIRTKREASERVKYQATDAASLLSAPAESRDDSLPVAYLAYRLGVSSDAAPTPSTPMIGLKALGYFDPPPAGSKAKPKVVGYFPCRYSEQLVPTESLAHTAFISPWEVAVKPIWVRSRAVGRATQKVRQDPG